MNTIATAAKYVLYVRRQHAPSDALRAALTDLTRPCVHEQYIEDLPAASRRDWMAEPPVLVLVQERLAYRGANALAELRQCHDQLLARARGSAVTAAAAATATVPGAATPKRIMTSHASSTASMTALDAHDWGVAHLQQHVPPARGTGSAAAAADDDDTDAMGVGTAVSGSGSSLLGGTICGKPFALLDPSATGDGSAASGPRILSDGEKVDAAACATYQNMRNSAAPRPYLLQTVPDYAQLMAASMHGQ